MPRVEHDYLGKRQLADDCYYGIQTLRGVEASGITGRSLVSYAPRLIYYMAAIKWAAAKANLESGRISEEQSDAISSAAREVMDGKWADQFPIDSFTGGGGVSIHMNINEVIANRANELMTGKKGYDCVHPNTHVNKGQSTNDVYPSALLLTLREMLLELEAAAGELQNALEAKADEYKDVVKLGRTCLQDALPMTWDQSFGGCAAGIARQRRSLQEIAEECLQIPLGGTAVGTGSGESRACMDRMYSYLKELIGIEIKKSENFFDEMQNADIYPRISGAIKGLALCVSKFSGDLRLLSSGPRAGFGELTLPSVLPGSSIMPGKINPILPELMKQVYFQIAGNDTAVTIAAEEGELELNVWEGLFLKCLMESGTMLEKGIRLFTEKCVCGIRVNREVCLRYAKNSTALSAVVSSAFGYEEGSRMARAASESGKTIEEEVVEYGLMGKEAAEEFLNPLHLTKQEE